MSRRSLGYCRLSAVLLTICAAPASAQTADTLKSVKLVVKPVALAHGPAVIDLAWLKKQAPDFTPSSYILVTSDKAYSKEDAKAKQFRVIASQADDLDGDGSADEIAFETDWPSKQSRVITVAYGDEATIAPLRAVATKKAHAIFSKKFEGVGWENDRVAWRLYDDNRNSIDLYAKNAPHLSLDYFALPKTNYEADSIYGRDIFWNGKAFGIGAVGAWVDGKLVRVADVAERSHRIVADGPVRAIAEMHYTGWRVGGQTVDLTSRFTIWAGQHWFKHDIFAKNAERIVFVSGLPIKQGTEAMTSPQPLKGADHRYVATWGAQVQLAEHEGDGVNSDKLGLAVVYSHGDIPSIPDLASDPVNHLAPIALHPNGEGQVTGRVAVIAGWDQESKDAMLPEATRSAQGWRSYVAAISPDIFKTASMDFAPAAAATVPASSVAQTINPAPLSRKSILNTMRRACAYQMEAQKVNRDNNWIRSTFYTGVLALYETTHERQYLDASLQWAESFEWKLAPGAPFFADNQCCIQVYADLARITQSPQKLAYAEAMYANEAHQTKPGRELWWWCDALFMAPAGMVRTSYVTGKPEYTALMNTLYWDSTDYFYDRESHLFYRDKTFFDKKTANGKKVFWSRGNGWVMGGLARLLEYLPASDPSRPRFVQLQQEMAAKLIAIQGKDGLWRASLDDPDEYPLPETSGSAFFVYSMAWGINHGTLDRKTYLPAVRRGWTALAAKVAPDGRLGYVQQVGGAPAKTSPSETQEYAVGALMLAGAEMVKLGEK
jgi:unsaturated rhamnogalacturonyl hydrolase